MKHITLIIFSILYCIAIFCAIRFSAFAQIPIPPVTQPAANQPMTIWCYNTDGTNVSAPSNEIQTTNGTFVSLSWSNTCSFVSGEYTVICWKFASGTIHYHDIGTNTSTSWPIPPQPTRVIGLLTGINPSIQWLNIINPSDNEFFKLYQTTESGYVSISDSTDLTNWTSSFAIFQTSNNCLNITANQLLPIHQP